MSIKGFKVFNPDWTCRGFQYKVGETFVHNGNIEMCGAGFHFCQKASDCFNYYNFNSQNKVAEVEALGLVETQEDKSVTDKIKIIREIEWSELLTIVNDGKNCTGLGNTGSRNTGDRNTGNWNTGSRNTGNHNTGDWNTGDWNTGNWNTGNHNTGDWNTGDWNTGNWNTGNRNTGDWNTGNRNTGNWNTGDRNTGNWNTGNRNTGDWNTGSRNTGDWNTGDWNSTNYSTGFFNSVEQNIFLFNKPTSMSRDEIHSLKGIQILNWNFENSWWIYSVNMSDDEKKSNPKYETTGGYLKTVDFKTACKMMWENLSENERQEVMKLPNFDSNIFYEITGIIISK
jgi:hypothetical protein